MKALGVAMVRGALFTAAKWAGAYVVYAGILVFGPLATGIACVFILGTLLALN